jgi:hypothetical protein
MGCWKLNILFINFSKWKVIFLLIQHGAVENVGGLSQGFWEKVDAEMSVLTKTPPWNP